MIKMIKCPVCRLSYGEANFKEHIRLSHRVTGEPDGSVKVDGRRLDDYPMPEALLDMLVDCKSVSAKDDARLRGMLKGVKPRIPSVAVAADRGSEPEDDEEEHEES